MLNVGGVACDESNPRFKKNVSEHQHPIRGKVSRSRRSKESLPKGLMLEAWRTSFPQIHTWHFPEQPPSSDVLVLSGGEEGT